MRKKKIVLTSWIIFPCVDIFKSLLLRCDTFVFLQSHFKPKLSDILYDFISQKNIVFKIYDIVKNRFNTWNSLRAQRVFDNDLLKQMYVHIR